MARPRKAPQVPGDAPEPEQTPVDAQDDAPEPEQTPVDAQDDAPPPTLPRACDIDPTKLSRSVLTQDGWICPA